MAGDWIKMRADLQRHPKVVRMSSALRADRFRIIGGLHAVWSLFDEHSEDGRIEGYTQEAIDDLIGWPGFCAAMSAVEWLDVSADFCGLPRFDEHNGQSAKRRAMETQRTRRERAEEEERLSALEADKKRSRTDKREEKKETPLPPAGGVVRFEDFWEAWPKNERKQDKVKCAKKWKASCLDASADAILADISIKRQTQKWQDGYVEAPLVYLNGKRWEDGVTPGASQADQSNLLAGAI
jgi:hypothetical protein